jgi:hypothetical protein
MIVAVFLLFAVASIQSAELRCEYIISPYQRRDYQCNGRIGTTKTDFYVDSVVGTHISGMTGDQVTEVMIYNSTMEVLPRNLTRWFRNYDEFGIASIEGLPNFSRGFFEGYSHLTYFFGYNIRSVVDVPRDTFWDMKRLTHLYLDGMTNMRNLDSDLLMYARGLQTFSVKGPNKIDQINPGFFRNQRNSLKNVDFRNTNLVKISYTLFDGFRNMIEARFVNSGCLDRMYFTEVATMVSTDIRKRCQDVGQNEIRKNYDDESSSESN